MRKPSSLAGVLFGRIGLVFVALILIAAAVTSQTARDQIDDAYDGQLIIAANVLQALMADEIRERAPATAESADPQTELSVDDSPLLSSEDRQAFDAFADWRMFRIWLGGKLVMRSDTGPPSTAAAPKAPGFEDIVSNKLKWRIYTLQLNDRPIVVQVGERLGIRGALVRNISLGLALPLLLLIPATALLIWLSLTDGLRAVRALVSALGRRSGRDLAPLPTDSWPSDLSPLVGSVNQLFGRIDQSLQHERRFIDQAAHQLRTPLSVVKLQAQMIAREDQPEERRKLITQLAGGVDRAALLIDRLLTLARLDNAVETGEVSDLVVEATTAIADLAPFAAQRKVALSFDSRMPAAIVGDPTLVNRVCANLIDNAIRFSPPGGEVDVRIQTEPGWHSIIVADIGPGIPVGERAQVLERFNRGATSRGEGVGLGLSIVMEALRLLGGNLDLRNRSDGLAGLEACVVLPALPAAKT